jgi:hypothetical protein
MSIASRRGDEPEAPPEQSRELSAPVPASVNTQWGRSESIDPDNVGDIADEGAGHRG